MVPGAWLGACDLQWGSFFDVSNSLDGSMFWDRSQLKKLFNINRRPDGFFFSVSKLDLNIRSTSLQWLRLMVTDAAKMDTLWIPNKIQLSTSRWWVGLSASCLTPHFLTGLTCLVPMEKKYVQTNHDMQSSNLHYGRYHPFFLLGIRRLWQIHD